jgi:uncharacterized membrane protein YeaQ/YmgE (transglycosylase-associated protein family)
VTEPITTTASLTASAATLGVSGITLALLGVDYFSILGGFVGTALTVTWAKHTQTRTRLAWESALSTYIGALIGTSMYAIARGVVPVVDKGGIALLVLVSLVGAMYFKQLLRSIGDRMIKEIQSKELPANQEVDK